MGQRDADEWERAHAVARLAETGAERKALLAGLREIRSLDAGKKHRTLDRIAKAFALSAIERPSLAECREAIGDEDAVPRGSLEILRKPASDETVAALVDFMVDAFGCSDEPRSGAIAPPVDQSGRQTFSASSAEHERTESGRLETENCAILTERKSTFFPGDVNSPPWEQEYVSIEGKRCGASCSVSVSLQMGDKQASLRIDGPRDERDRIHAKFWRALT